MSSLITTAPEWSLTIVAIGAENNELVTGYDARIWLVRHGAPPQIVWISPTYSTYTVAERMGIHHLAALDDARQHRSR